MVPSRCGQSRAQLGQSLVAVERHLARRKLVSHRVFRKMEGEIVTLMSASSIYSNHIQVLMYGIAAVYSPVIISPFYFPNNETLQVYVTSDSWNTVHGIAQLTLFDWYGGNISSQSIIFTVPSLNNTLIYSGTGLNSFLLPDTDVADVWLYLELTAEVDSSITRHEQQVSRHFTSTGGYSFPLISSYPCRWQMQLLWTQ